VTHMGVEFALLKTIVDNATLGLAGLVVTLLSGFVVVTRFLYLSNVILSVVEFVSLRMTVVNVIMDTVDLVVKQPNLVVAKVSLDQENSVTRMVVVRVLHKMIVDSVK